MARGELILRQWNLLKMLQTRGEGISLRDLAEQLEVSERTIQRDFEVLQELGIDAQLEQLPPQDARGFDTPEQALEQLARRLYLSPGSHKRKLLEGILPDLLEEADGMYRIRGARPLEPSLVSWQPGTTVAQLC